MPHYHYAITCALFEQRHPIIWPPTPLSIASASHANTKTKKNHNQFGERLCSGVRLWFQRADADRVVDGNANASSKTHGFSEQDHACARWWREPVIVIFQYLSMTICNCINSIWKRVRERTHAHAYADIIILYTATTHTPGCKHVARLYS